MLKLRKAQIADCQRIYDLRNDPLIRKVSFSGDSFSLESHTAWFENALKNPLRQIFVVEDGSGIAGVVRFDLNAERSEALVSVYVSPNHWGKGVGTFALNEGEAVVKKDFPSLKGIVAEVMAGNDASIHLFEKCRYKRRPNDFYKEVR
jgi:UDP-2,4-diacetamido-2,4,6-trideoxy-beta-L-altropyranose hydrolase